jgi:hypothetical protein
LSPRPAKTAWPIFTIYTSNDAVSRKEVPFGDPNASKNFQGVHFPQKTKFGPGIGISSLNKTINNFATQSAQPGEIHSKLSTQRQKFWSRGHFWRKNVSKGDYEPKPAAE